ncbi:hypothetical protein SBRY_90287 [Actinacidiphila bryophytorum]|uniref:Uncharacterized protein n=1 Tax=Actinacidiphila bryophytorum TaxID=1436133 RepID=A0A9W4H8T8_9ACTN|nr:hypothetical protein SBRY_90287 [Actinacidiphila bryophytorum]
MPYSCSIRWNSISLSPGAVSQQSAAARRRAASIPSFIPSGFITLGQYWSRHLSVESSSSLLQKGVLDPRQRTTRQELRIAIVTWIERTHGASEQGLLDRSCSYRQPGPTPRRSACGPGSSRPPGEEDRRHARRGTMVAGTSRPSTDSGHDDAPTRSAARGKNRVRWGWWTG